MALRLSGQIPIPLNPDMIFFLISVRSITLSIHLANVILSSFVSFLVTIVVSFSFLKVLLKGLKQATSKG